MRSQPVDQGTIAISIVTVQIKIFNLRLQVSERQIEDAAQGEIIFHFRTRLGPLHVIGFGIHILSLKSGISNRATEPYLMDGLLPRLSHQRSSALSEPGPDKIRRQTGQHNTETDGAIAWLLVDHTKRYDTARGDKENCREGMTRNAKEVSIAARALTSPEYKHAHRRQGKEHHVYRHDIIQDLFEAAGDQRDDDCETALQRYRKGRYASVIEPGEPFEEESILGHGEINSRGGQHALTQKADGGNGDAGS